MNEQSLIELEIKLAYQEDLLQVLNDTVAKQQQQISRLEMTCKLLHERVQNIHFATQGETDLQVPPHY